MTDAIWFVSPLVTARALDVTVTSSLSQACFDSVPGLDELAIRACNAGLEFISIMQTLLLFPTLLTAATVSTNHHADADS